MLKFEDLREGMRVTGEYKGHKFKHGRLFHKVGDLYGVHIVDGQLGNIVVDTVDDALMIELAKGLEGLRYGDILVKDSGNEHKVLGVCGDVVFLSCFGDHDASRAPLFHYKELESKYTLKNDVNARVGEDSDIVELTHKEIAEKFEVDVDKLRIKE